MSTKKETRLVSFTSKKDGKVYRNFVLVWNYQGKTWKVHIKPSFKNDFKVLLATSEQE